MRTLTTDVLGGEPDPVTQEYGPTDYSGEWRRPDGSFFHTGIDIAAAYGTPVRVTWPGTVVRIGDPYGGPNAVTIRLDRPTPLGGTYARILHLATETLAIGQHVEPGDLEGTEGSLGNSTGPHVHVELRTDTADGQGPVGSMDPSELLYFPPPAPPAQPTTEDDMPRQSDIPMYPELIAAGQKAYTTVRVNCDEDSAFLTATGCDAGDTVVDLVWTDADTGVADPGLSAVGVAVPATEAREAKCSSGVRRGVIVNHGPGSVIAGCKVEPKS